MKGDSAVDCTAPAPGDGGGGGDSDDRAPNAGCGDAPPAEPELGACEPAPIECDSALDCPAGLACRTGGDSVCTSSSDGGDQPKCEPTRGPGRCVYEIEECEENADCEAGYACTLLGGAQECSAPPGAPCPRDGNCPPPPEPTCTKREDRVCFPIRVDCQSDTQCGSDQRCVTLNDDVRDDAPEGWENAQRVCLPEGLALAIEGKVDVGGGTVQASSDTAGESDPKGVPSESGVAQPRDGDVEIMDDGCAVTAPGRAGTSASMIALLGLIGMAFARRRRTPR